MSYKNIKFKTLNKTDAVGVLDLTDKKISKPEVSLVDTLNEICLPLPTIYKDD